MIVSCPSCGSGTQPGATHCWLCRYPLTGAQAVAPPVPIPHAQPQRSWGWLVAVILAVFIMFIVAIELAFLAPGLLIPYAVVLVPVMVVLGRIVYVQRLDFWKPKNAVTPQPQPQAPQPQPLGPRGDQVPQEDVAGKVVTGIAMGLLGVAVVVGVLVLLAIAAFIILMVICFASLAGGP